MLAISQPPPTIVKRARIKTGTYTGIGGDDRNIDIGVDLAAKSHPYVILNVNAAGASRQSVHRIEYAQGDLSMDFGAATDLPDFIQSFTATGFQVGALQNENGQIYRYIAFWDEP